MANRMNRTIIALILIVLSPVLANGETIFSDNFDSCTVNCNATTISPPNSAGWSQWATGYVSDTIGGVQHYSGEITSPGRGGSGKSLKMWRAAGVFGDYTGALVWTGGSGQTHFYMGYSLKIPKAFQYTGDPGGSGFKSWRLITDSGIAGKNEIYLNFNAYGATWSIYDGSGWTIILSRDQKSTIWDGNWHSIVWEFGLSTKILRLWVDDVLKYEDTNRTWNVTGGLSWINHFNIGNTLDHSGAWQTGWQAMELDDFVLSTSKVDPVSVGDESKKPTPPFNLQWR